MANEYILIAYYLMWGLLVFSAICFFLSGVDDLFFDVYYWVTEGWRKWKYRHEEDLSYRKFADLPEKKIAVMVPCWHEAGVINIMLQYNVCAIDYENYDFFVGMYPNDPLTVAEVQRVSQSTPHVQCVVGATPGPTNKASNLNTIYQAIMEYEEKNNVHYDIFVLHDSEDIIHPLGFKLFNYLIPKKDMVQLPIFPLEVPIWEVTHWTYAAEFSEIHTKDILVRERIGGLVPSAGVGTAFSRAALDVLKSERHGVPFSINTLTEDYSTSLQIRLHGLKSIFASQMIYRSVWAKKWYFFGKPVLKKIKERVATRSLFPTSYTTSVRQKTRWIFGVGFQEWINTGWRGNFATLYTLLHDRKSLFTHLITGLFFILTPFWMVYLLFVSTLPDYPTLQDNFDLNPWVWFLIAAASVMMAGRVLQRMISIYRVYGLWPALLSPPLILYTNVINMHALLRAYGMLLFTPKAKKGTVHWDKTDHKFPGEHLLVPFKRKLGDLLVQEGLLTPQQLKKVLLEQVASGQQIGELLINMGYLTPQKLIFFLAKQYKLEIVPEAEAIRLPFSAVSSMSQYAYDRLIQYHAIPIKLTDKKLTIAIYDPANEVALAKIVRWVSPYIPHFVLISPKDR